MPAIKIDQKIATFASKLKRDKRFGEGSTKDLVGRAVLFFLDKHERCPACEFHRDQVAGLELGRQQVAKKDGIPPGGKWVVMDHGVLRRAHDFAKKCGRPVRYVVEQAILEHVTRPPNCQECGFYSEMSATVEAKREREADDARGTKAGRRLDENVGGAGGRDRD